MRRGETRRKVRLLAALLALATAVVCACFVTGAGRSTRVFGDLLTRGLDFGGAPGKTFSLDSGAQYGVLNSGPYYSLPAGRYALTWTTECDATNRIRLTSSNGARIEPQEMTIHPDRWTDGAAFELLDDAENLQIQVCFESGTVLKLHDLRLSFTCTDGLWAAAWLLALLWALWALEACGYLTDERKRILLILAAAVLVASVPALRENLNAGHDSEFHRMRLRNVVSALGEGQFPVRVGGSMYNGYGSATSIFYPDTCLYLAALMMLGGATIQFALSAMLIALNAVTAASAYACGRRMFGSRTAGTCASVLYTLAAYRLTDLYTRMALGEAAAMAVIPLFILGLWEVVFGDKRRWPMLVIGATAVFRTHMITTVLCAAGAAVLCAVCLVRMIREGRLSALLAALAATVLLNLYALVPLADCMLGGISMGTLSSSVSAGAMRLAELFAQNPQFPRDIGAALLIGTVVTAHGLIGKRTEDARTACALLLGGIAMALMATKLFPWAALEKRFGGAINFLQFPWRLLMFADIFLALACGYGVSQLSGDGRWQRAAALAVLAVSVLASSAQIQAYTVNDVHDDRYWLSNSEMITAYGEYTLPGSDLARTVTEHEVLTTGDAAVTAYEKKGTRVTAQVQAQQGGSVVLPVFGFDGYRAELNGQEIAWHLGENNRLTVDIPAGTSGELSIRYAGKALWRIADAVSLLTAAGLAAWLIRRRKR